MSHMIDVVKVGNFAGAAAAVYASGRGQVRAAWHQLGIHCEVESLDLAKLPAEARDMVEVLLGKVAKAPLVDPVSGAQAFGLEGISHDSMGLLGWCGGRNRSNWTPAQPREVWEMLSGLMEASGGSIEGLMWLTDGSLIIEGMLPSDAKIWGKDRHEVRFCAELNFSGRRADRLMVSLTRVVCNNTRAIAVHDAGSKGSLLRIPHSGDTSGRWEIDGAALLADCSERVEKVRRELHALGKIKVGEDRRAQIFANLIGPAPAEDAATVTKNRHDAAVSAFVEAFQVERDSATEMGLDPDSARVLYETVTRVSTHSDVLVKGRSEETRRMALLAGDAQIHIDTLLASVGLGDAKLMEELTADFLAGFDSEVEEQEQEVSILDDIFNGIA